MSSSAYNDPKAGERIAGLFSKSDREELDRLRLEKKIREGQADADALRELALYHCPSDIVSFANTHRLPTFVEVVWVQAFVAGWRQRVPSISKCFECSTDLMGPFCPACNPEMANCPNQTTRSEGT